MGIPHFVSLFVILFFIMWFGIAVANIINPRWIWKLTQSWKAFREPPRGYFMLQRLWAIIMLAIGLAFVSFFRR